MLDKLSAAFSAASPTDKAMFLARVAHNSTVDASAARVALALVLAGSLEGCVYQTDLLRSATEIGTANSRPESTIGPEGWRTVQWRVYRIELNPNAAKLLLFYGPTVHLIASDCDGTREFAWEDIYVDGVTINGSSGASASAKLIDAALDKEGGRLLGVSYIDDVRVRTHLEFCFHADGGTMWGLGFRSNMIKVTPQEAR